MDTAYETFQILNYTSNAYNKAKNYAGFERVNGDEDR
jgi:hypothetical protein